jgi:hypothetical protein
MAVRTKLLVDSVDAFVLGLESPVKEEARAAPGRARAAGARQSAPKSLRDLGLERKAREVTDLSTCGEEVE